MKFKERAKGSIYGFMAGVILTTSVPVIAQQVTKNINVTYRNIKIYADGNKVDTSGDKEAFIYNGTTYLPVKAIGDAFNKSVSWDGKNSAVYIGAIPTNTGQPTVLLKDLDYFTKTIYIGDMFDNGKDNVGNVHSTGYGIGESSKGSIQYLLNGKYRRFAGSICVPYNQRDDSNEVTIKIYGDGKLLYTSPVMTAGVKPASFNVDITGVLNLEIEKSGYGFINICDAGFYA